MPVRIKEVKPNSAAHRAGIAAGDRLVAINQNPIADLLDYNFYLTECHVQISLEGPERGPYTIRIKKGQYEDIGLSFESYLMDEHHSCRNSCIFCFIDQNPPGMRKSIYFKDDDDRLSFLFGNYITMTNLSDADIDRIIKMHISPVNISVHATDPAVRVQLMRNPTASNLWERLSRLTGSGIRINTQLVLCPGINDGKVLRKSLNELGSLYPGLQSIACVPVGLTGYRDKLYPLRPFTEGEAGAVIDSINAFADEMQKRYGERVAYPADEFFLMAGYPTPPAEYYGEFAQLENGVGLMAILEQEFNEALLERAPERINDHLSIATGMAAAPQLLRLCESAIERNEGLKIHIYPIENRFFGGHITVAGLLTGQDIATQLSGRELGSRLIIPSCMLRSEGDCFLDDMTVEELKQKLGVPVTVIPAGGYPLLEEILSGGEKDV